MDAEDEEAEGEQAVVTSVFFFFNELKTIQFEGCCKDSLNLFALMCAIHIHT